MLKNLLNNLLNGIHVIQVGGNATKYMKSKCLSCKQPFRQQEFKTDLEKKLCMTCYSCLGQTTVLCLLTGQGKEKVLKEICEIVSGMRKRNKPNFEVLKQFLKD